MNRYEIKSSLPEDKIREILISSISAEFIQQFNPVKRTPPCEFRACQAKFNCDSCPLKNIVKMLNLSSAVDVNNFKACYSIHSFLFDFEEVEYETWHERIFKTVLDWRFQKEIELSMNQD